MPLRLLVPWYSQRSSHSGSGRGDVGRIGQPRCAREHDELSPVASGDSANCVARCSLTRPGWLAGLRQVQGRTGQHGYRRHRVRDRIVQFTGDAQSLLRHGAKTFRNFFFFRDL